MEAKLTKRRVGRPCLNVDLDELRRLRQKGLSFRQIARTLGIAPSTAFHLWRDGATPRNGRKGVQKIVGFSADSGSKGEKRG